MTSISDLHQYELDGSTETFDPTMPSTTACPYLPGQAVNTLAVPSQKCLRQRSASLNSMRITDYQVIDPQAKFISLRPVTPTPSEVAAVGKRSAPGLLRHAASSRSLSPSPAWKRLFGYKSHNDERGRSRDRREKSAGAASVSTYADSQSPASSRSRNGSISPESLRRFLSDDIPPRPSSNLSEHPAIIIPEDIAEENEDDDNFATSAVSESQPFATGLSPPPYQRSVSSETVPLTTKNLSSLTINTGRPTTKHRALAGDVSSAGEPPVLDSISQSRSYNFNSTTSSGLGSPLSVTKPEDEMLTFYDDSNDDDGLSHEDLNELPIQHSLQSQFMDHDDARLKLGLSPTFGVPASPRLVIPDDAGRHPTTSRFLPTPTDTGVEDFASELGWIVHAISTRGQ